MMRLYLDSADIEGLDPLMSWGAFAGVTTNPVILAQAGLSLEDAARQLSAAQPGDLFLQVDGRDADEMERRVRELNDLCPSRIMMKIPPTPVGLEVIHRLKDERIWTAATAIFTAGQALLAANAGADIVIPFFSRIAKSGADAVEVVDEIVKVVAQRGGRPRVLVASVKTTEDVLAVAKVGAWAATIPLELGEALLVHPGTTDALERFAEAAAGSREVTEE